jgi:hypothetical protein
MTTDERLDLLISILEENALAKKNETKNYIMNVISGIVISAIIAMGSLGVNSFKGFTKADEVNAKATTDLNIKLDKIEAIKKRSWRNIDYNFQIVAPDNKLLIPIWDKEDN